MDDLTGFYFEDIEVGMTASFGKTITEADIWGFAAVSGDTNPVHINEEYAKGTMFKGRIAHGILSAGLISCVLGTKLPGPGAIYVNQSLKFKAPVMIGDTVTARVEVTGTVADKGFVELKTQCFIGDRLAVDGSATLMVPKKG